MPVFDNWRMLHGRSEFTGKRRLCGGYSTFFFLSSYYQQKLTYCFLILVNNDDFLSRFRLLKNGREKVLNDIGTYSTRQSL